MKSVLLIYRGRVFDTEIKPRLEQFKDDNITLITENKLTRNLVSHLIRDYKQKINLFTVDEFLDDNIITKFMKFNGILINPPYQKDGNPQVKLWPKIVQKSIELLNDNGTLCAIFPSVWTKRPNGQKWAKLVENFQKNDLTYVKIDDCNKFFKEEDTAYIIIKNQKYNGITKIETTSNKYTSEIEYKGQPIILSEDDLIQKSIIDKVNIKKEKWNWFEDLNHNDSKEYLFGNNILFKKSKENTLPIWYTASQKYYTDESNVEKGYRVLVNLSGYYFSDELPDKYIKVCLNEGCTSGMRAILVKSEDEGNRVKKILTSKLYRFYNNSQKTSGFNTSIGKMPKLDINRNWLDLDIYTEFNLTEIEINYVEKYIG